MQFAEVLSVEGAMELPESAFSLEGLSFVIQLTANGKVNVTVMSTGIPPSVFLRVKVKWTLAPRIL